MDFSLTKEQKMLRDLFREFAANEVAPLAQDTDEHEKPPLEALQKAAAQGFLGALVPEAMGGVELDAVSYCMLLEELARACTSTALTVSVHNGLATKAILEHGNERLKDAHIGAMARGEKIGAWAFTEAAAGSDAASLETTAQPRGPGYVLNGGKIWVANGEIADVFLVFAKTSADSRVESLSAFVLDRGMPGFQIGYREKTLGLRGLSCNALYFDECRVPAEHLLGREQAGNEIAKHAMDFSRLSLSAICLGGACAALDAGVQYAATHEQFGGPIARKQAVQNLLADTTAEIEALRHLVYHTAWLADRGDPYARAASIAKLIGSRTAVRASDRMLQVHGGYGYMKEFAIERLYRDLRALEILEGPSEIQRVFIAADILKKQGLAIEP